MTIIHPRFKRLLCLRQISTISTMHSVEETFLSLELSAVVMAGIPNWLSILGNIETTSNETKMASSGKGPCLLSFSIFCKKMCSNFNKRTLFLG